MGSNTKALFRATRHIPDISKGLFGEMEEQLPPEEHRREDDFYPTGQPEAIRGLLSKDSDRIRECGGIWENSVGDGALARILEEAGIPCFCSDLVDRGWPGTEIRDFYDYDASPCRGIIANPPYQEINARDGHGRWLRHSLSLPDWDYMALLLGWDWPAARQNGLGALLEDHPFSYCYLMRWKLDFTGEGSPPQRNAWFVWDKKWQGSEPAFRWMDRADNRQLSMV